MSSRRLDETLKKQANSNYSDSQQKRLIIIISLNYIKLPLLSSEMSVDGSVSRSSGQILITLTVGNVMSSP
jgi:hypothetical protein